MQIPSLARRLARRRDHARPTGNRRRQSTGARRRPRAETSQRSTARGVLPGLRKARGADSPSAPPGWGRRALHLGLRLGIAGSVAWGLLVGVREGYAYATTSPRFEVRGLIYEPTPHVDDARLRELLALPPGTNILSLELTELAARVAEDPWVAKASVVRVLPDSLEVTVEEHEPQAVLLLAGRLLLVDAEGTAFKELQTGERGRLPVLTGFDDPQLLERSEDLQPRVLRGLHVLLAYRAKLRPRLSEVHVGDFGEVTLYTAEMGTQLRMGRGEVEPALARYDALRAALGEEAEKLALVHLDAERAPGRPDRIVASFFPAKQAPSLLAEAEARAAEKAAEAAREAEEAAQAKGKGKSKGKGKTNTKGTGAGGRLPRYE
ncbi:cell division protein FtsQ/DivIB [Paraliomyxa miuraensis]|uniref:cell division protein FtsQ/DivIB n=1 Tax=Paraliomyxa miuraensis TaxID=376150 RepID=UPI00225A61EB|nr:FtsQ-type POTRA domain-containing protein [Paraliomyxa miuraensis]MCX4242131.1 FtsQ-type POTRA domain-containing protein [Paraliomyxa miuraensis]